MIKAHEEVVGLRMITLRIHAKAESRQCGPLFIMFSGPSRMFHQPEKYDSDFTDTLSGFSAGIGRDVFLCVCVVDMHVKVIMCIYSERGRAARRERWKERRDRRVRQGRRKRRRRGKFMLRICSGGVTFQHWTDNRVNTLCTGLGAE